MKAGVAAMLAIAAAVTISGCTSNVDGRAICPGCGPGGEPNFPTDRPTVSSPTPSTSKPPTSKPPTSTAPTAPVPGGTLPPSDEGYVYIETKSGLTRCQISTDSVGCESQFTNSPEIDGVPANGVEVTADGTMRWILGNLGAIPTTTIDYATYHAVGWTIDASSSGTRFTNDATGHGMSVSTEGTQVF